MHPFHPGNLSQARSMRWRAAWPQRYGLAVLAVAAATVLQFAIGMLGPSHLPFLLYFPTIVLVAMCAGFGPGILATVLAASFGGFFFLEPRNSFVVRTPEDLVGPALFAFIGVFLTFLTCSGKRAERALRDSEDRYRDLVEHSEDLVCTHDLEGRLLSVNPAPARVLGYEAEELLKTPMREILAPEFREQFDEYLRKIAANGKDRGLLCVVARGGERRIWEYSNTLRTEGVASPIVRGMAHDVTERMRAEAALRQSEAALKRAQAVAHLGSWLYHIQKNTLTLSDELYRIMGLRAGTPVTRDQAIDILCPEDRERIVRTWSAALKSGEYDEECRVCVDGRIRWLHVQASVECNGSGEPVKAFGTAYDITERKAAEEALKTSEENYRNFVTQSSEGIFREDLAAPLPIDLPEDEIILRIRRDS